MEEKEITNISTVCHLCEAPVIITLYGEEEIPEKESEHIYVKYTKKGSTDEKTLTCCGECKSIIETIIRLMQTQRLSSSRKVS